MAIEKLLGQSVIWRGFYFFTSLLTNILLSRYLQASLSGQVLYLANIFSFIALALGLGLDSGLTYFASRKIISYNKLLVFSLLWVVGIALVGLVTSGFFLPVILQKSTMQIEGIKHYAILYVAGTMMMNFFSGLFYSKSNYWLPNLLYSCVNLFAVILIPIFGTYLSGKTSLLADVYFYSTFLQGLLLLPFFIVYYARQEERGFLPTISDGKKLISFSSMALGANIIFFLINRVDFFFVEKYCTSQNLGNYILVSRLGQMLLFFPQVLASVIFPQTAGTNDNSNVAESTMVIGRLLSRLYIIVFIIVVVFGKWLFPLVFGNTFSTMYGLMLIFLPGFFALSHLAVIAAFFLGNGKVKVNMAGTLIALVFVITGDVLVVKRFGIYAAAMVSALAYISNFIYAIVRFRREYNISLAQLFVWRKEDLYWIKKMFVKKPVHIPGK